MLTRVCYHLNYELETDGLFDTFTPKLNSNFRANNVSN